MLDGFATSRDEALYPNLWDGLQLALAAGVTGPTGNTWWDLSGRGNRGTLVNMDPATDWVRSGNGLALDFDGANDSVTLSDFADMPQWSVSMWLRWSGAGTNFACPFAGKFGAINGNGIAAISPGRYSVLRANNAIANTQYTSTAGQWVPVVASWDGTNARLWAFGIEATTGPADTGYGITTTRLAHGFSSNYYSGQMDSICVYNRTLHPDEIRTLASDRYVLYQPGRRRSFGSVAVSGNRRRRLICGANC